MRTQALCIGDVDFSEVVLALTEDAGVDVALDTVGSPIFRTTFRCLGQYGRLVLLGELSGQDVPLPLAEVIFRDAAILGSSGAGRDDLKSALDLVQQGKARTPWLPADSPWSIGQAAYEAMAEGAHVGRFVLAPN